METKDINEIKEALKHCACVDAETCGYNCSRYTNGLSYIACRQKLLSDALFCITELQKENCDYHTYANLLKLLADNDIMIVSTKKYEELQKEKWITDSDAFKKGEVHAAKQCIEIFNRYAPPGNGLEHEIKYTFDIKEE